MEYSEGEQLKGKENNKQVAKILNFLPVQILPARGQHILFRGHQGPGLRNASAKLKEVESKVTCQRILECC